MFRDKLKVLNRQNRLLLFGIIVTYFHPHKLISRIWIDRPLESKTQGRHITEKVNKYLY